jgi:hypothetical protein
MELWEFAPTAFFPDDANALTHLKFPGKKQAHQYNVITYKIQG